MTYLVTGATGGLGSYALDFLKDFSPISDIYALVRSREKGKKLEEAGFNIRIGDYGDADSMKSALQGIDRLLFISGATGNRQAEHKNVVDSAKKAGVSYIVYTSLANADKSTSPLAADHIFTEKLIEESGIKHTILRNNWYLENEMPLISAALNSGKFVYTAEDGKSGWALKREYAEAAAKAVYGALDNFPSILELSGSPATYEELVASLNKVTSKNIEALKSDGPDFIENLVSDGFPQPAAEMFLSFQDIIKSNQLDVASDDFEKVLGKPLQSLEDALRELLA